MKGKSRLTSCGMLISPPEKKIREAIVISCFACPQILENPELLSSLGLLPGNYELISVLGVTDTFLSGSARKGVPGISMKMNHIFKSYNINRVILLTDINCEEDYSTKQPRLVAERLKFRKNQLYEAEQIIKGWFPQTSNGVKIESYYFKSVQGGMLRVKKLAKKLGLSRSQAD